MALKVGIQLYSVRDEMKKDPINAIRQVAEIGYKNLEFASSNADTDPGVGFGVSVEDMQKLLKETGANLISGHIRPINEETIDPMIAYHTQVGTKYLGQSADFYTGYDQLMSAANITTGRAKSSPSTASSSSSTTTTTSSRS